MRYTIAIPLLFLASPALGDEIMASDPVKLDVTIYRDPGRYAGTIDLEELGGFAVVTEQRRVTIPAGRHRLSFEGVIAGIVPESAIITGLPGGVLEKNQYADLMSPSALARAAQGKKLTLTRTDPATGKKVSTSATLVSAGPDGAVFKSAAGIETLRCSGLPESFRYSTAMAGPPGKPTLSVQTRSTEPVETTVTLTYLAENFDWAANYTLHFNADRRTFDLGGWITLANGNDGSLPQANTKVVAGRVNREEFERFVDDRPDVIAKCWAMQTTSDIPLKPDRPYELVRPILGSFYANVTGEIVVTAQLRRQTLQDMPVAVTSVSQLNAEKLGDLKLYSVPWPTSVAAHQMKQIRLFDRRALTGDPYYSGYFPINERVDDPVWELAVLALRTRNDKAHGLGLPIPSGRIQQEQDQFGRTMVLGEGSFRDTAVNEKIVVGLGDSADVSYRLSTLSETMRGKDTVREQRVEVSNALPFPIIFEVGFGRSNLGVSIEAESIAMTEEDGVKFWRLTLPANGTSQLTFRAVELAEIEEQRTDE